MANPSLPNDKENSIKGELSDSLSKRLQYGGEWGKKDHSIYLLLELL